MNQKLPNLSKLCRACMLHARCRDDTPQLAFQASCFQAGFHITCSWLRVSEAWSGKAWTMARILAALKRQARPIHKSVKDSFSSLQRLPASFLHQSTKIEATHPNFSNHKSGDKTGPSQTMVDIQILFDLPR